MSTGTAEIAREALRRETAATHERVEATLRLGEPGVSMAAYHTAVEALLRGYGAVAAWVPSLAPRLDAPLLLARLDTHLARLRADWAYTALALGRPDAVPPGPMPPPPAAWGLAHGFGMLYVVEGSTLGGQHVARHLGQSALGLHPERGLTFFAGDGPETGRLWRAFRADLARFVSTEPAVGMAVDGAQWAFAADLQAWEQAGR